MKFSIILLSLLLTVALIGGCAYLNSETRNVTFVLTWTATGDDGIVGRASHYDMRYAFNGSTLENNWTSSDSVLNMPVPSLAGQRDSVLFNTNVEVGSTIYFALKVNDEVPNTSQISNIVSYYIPDDIPPSAVIDLNVSIR